MNTIAITLTQEELTLLFFGLAAAVLLLFILCIVLFVKLDKQKKRYDFFMGTNRKPSYNLESKLESYYSVSKGAGYGNRYGQNHEIQYTKGRIDSLQPLR